MSESTMNGNDNNAVAVHMSGNPRARRLRSLVWNDFTKEKNADGNYVAICNHCSKQLTASSRSGTTHLKNHLATCTNTNKRAKRRKLVVRRLVLKSGEARIDGANFDQSQFDQDLSRQDLARMIVLHGYPFTIVHHVGFRTFVRNLQPQSKLMSHDVVRADCMKIYENGMAKLQQVLDKLSCRVNLTADMWRSSEDVEYLCLTSHYVDDDWRLKRKVLNFLHVENQMPGEEIGKIIAEKLHEWGMHRKLFSVLLDNCSDGDVVASELSKFVQQIGSLPLSGELFHVRCAAAVLNLIAQDVTTVAGDIINRVRDSVQYVKSSQAVFSEFQNVAKKLCAPQKQLVLDVPDNWSSTYLMLETACEFQDVFACLAECDSEYMNSLSHDDWNAVKAVTECLEVFYQAIDKFSRARIPTANLYFNDICGIHLLLKNWQTSTFPVVSSMASQIFRNFDQYWGITRLVMAVASVLDPRYKMKSIEYFFKQIYDDAYETNLQIENIRKCLVNLYNEYVVQSNDTTKSQAFLCYFGSSSGGGSTEWKDGAESKTSSRSTLSDARRGLDQYLQEASSSQPQKSDLDLYLDEAVHLSKGLDDNFNILAWWKFHAAKYPVLSIMARDILAIPVSLIGLDYEGRTLNQYLSSMDPVTVQGLICGQDWLRDEFEVQVSPQEPTDGVLTVSLATNGDGDIDECMIPANGDDFSMLSK